MALVLERFAPGRNGLSLPTPITQCYKIMQAVHTDAEDFLFLVNRKNRCLTVRPSVPQQRGALSLGAGFSCQVPWNAPKIYLTYDHLSNDSQSGTAVLEQVYSGELSICVFYHKLATASTCRSGPVWINLQYVWT
jgi:hypothetical protein